MSIILSRNGKNAVKLEKTGFPAEDALQAYIYMNPESIPLYDLKEGLKSLVIMRELPTATGPIDAIAVDNDAEVYCIETKLFKNPDKRQVVAQILDYGASLWRYDFTEFTSRVNAYIAKTLQTSLQERLQTHFEMTPDDTTEFLAKVQANLSGAKFKFVVLMDKLPDHLKELVLFLNENSQFDIYAVEMELYKHTDLEILIPRIFGDEVKKAVGSSGTSQRRKWDEQGFFAEIDRVLKADQVQAIQALYEFAKSNAKTIGWGTGKARGSFSPRFPAVAERSLFSCFTDGSLMFNFGWLFLTESEINNRNRLAQKLREIGFSIPTNVENEWTNLPLQVWMPRRDAILNVLSEITSN